MNERRNPWEPETSRGWLKALVVSLVVLLFVGIAGVLISQPTFRKNSPTAVTVDPARLKAHVLMFSQTFFPRDWTHVDNLNRCADYISEHFSNAGANLENQPFDVRGKTYRNVIGRFGAGKGSKIIIGAHYDACGEFPGADDNASGIAALLELADLFQKHPPNREIELVAYSLEEPPFFRTPSMGSAFHAKQLAKSGEAVAGVIVFDMIGIYSDERGSQRYPSILLKLFYPGRGNFIGVIGRWDQGDWIKQIKIGMKGATDLPVYSIRAPAEVPGIDFSDHHNYWPHGIPALMISDTAFYRNRAYHSQYDTADRLDYERMAKTVVAVFEAVQSIPLLH